MPKFPVEYLKPIYADPSAIYTPRYQFDSRGRLVMPWTPYHKHILSTTPGSKTISTGTESQDSLPETDPGSLRTGSLFATTVITVGGTILLDAENSRISVGANPASAGYSIIMDDSFLVGYEGTNIRFGFFLADFDANMKEGDFFIGNIGTSQYALWDASEGEFIIHGSIFATTGTIGGWTIGASELSATSINLQSSAQRILLGAATDATTGIGIFVGLDTTYQISAGDPASYDDLEKAYREGSIVILDELNLDPALEKILNDLLTSDDTKDAQPKMSPFVIVSTGVCVRPLGLFSFSVTMRLISPSSKM